MYQTRTAYELRDGLPPLYDGVAPTGARVPYVVQRPLMHDAEDLAVSGSAVVWDSQMALYCVAGSVAASHALALDVIRHMHGHRVGGSTVSVGMGYSGARIEGLYESQLTLQINEGVL